MADAVEEVVEETVDGKINVDPNNPALTKVETDRQEIIDGYTTTIDGVIDSVGPMVEEQKAAIGDGAQKLIDAQNDYTDATVDIIEGQQEEARKDYEDEARGAYVDWKRQSNPFGANAEQMMANGLSGSGYSETSKVRMYQSYQNRKAMAFEAFSKAKTEYNNQITMAREQNSLTIAQIATDALKEKAKIALEGFFYKSDLIIEKANKELEINSLWQDERDRLNNDEEEIIVENDGNGVDLPSLTTGNKSLDRMVNVANGLGNYPNFPTLPNGQAPHLTMEEVGIENIHSVDDSNIKKELGDISAERLAALVGMGAIKEVLYEDKDGKIGLKFEIVNLEMAKKWMTGPTSSGRAATGMGAITRVNK